ncbi:MAG: hypothetical protein JXN59_15545 [Anaerolineae bacterium]|nr:hypothetical protein [Anaerolineae bacterium]
MRHPRFLNLSLLLGGVLLFSLAGIAFAQGGDPLPDYQGRNECSSCHRGLSRDHTTSLHANALIPITAEGAGIVADFSAGAEARTLTLPGEDAARPFTLDDAVYALGAGRYAQRFIVADSEGTLFVLPVEWNAVDSQWQPFTLAESWPDPAYNFVENCVYCHVTGLDREAGTWVDDGVQCEACHGPGAAHITLADEAGIRPTNAELVEIRTSIFNEHDSQVCGQCHSAGTAPDGRPYPLGYVPGNALLDDAVFTLSMPETNDVSNTNDIHWWASGHAKEVNMQFNELLLSGHASALETLKDSDYASNDCLRCHSGDFRFTERMRDLFQQGVLDGDTPDSLTLATAEQGVTCQTCHFPHQEEESRFFLWDEPYALCVDCHSNQGFEGSVHHPDMEMFEGITLVEEVAGIPSAHFSAEDGPDCVSCHMPRLPATEGDRASHSLRSILPGAPDALEAVAGCTTCHTEVSVEQIATFITETQENILTRAEAAGAATTDDTPGWVDLALAMVRGDGSRGLHNYSYTHALLSAAEAQLGLLPEAPAEPAEPEAEWVELPLLGVVEGLTTQGLIAVAAGSALLGLAGLVLLFAPAWRRLLGIGLLVAAVALATAPWWALEVPSQQAQASGDNSYCMLCHAGERSYTLVDGNSLALGVSLDDIAASVHGAGSSMGLLGCVDCHGERSFPHDPAPTSLREYRLAGVSLCSDCHLDSLDHYEDVLESNIMVGCVDCHGSHNVQPAETLDNFTPARILPTRSPEATPGVTLPSRENPMQEGPPATPAS